MHLDDLARRESVFTYASPALKFGTGASALASGAEQVASGHPIEGLFPMNAEWRARYESEVGK